MRTPLLPRRSSLRGPRRPATSSNRAAGPPNRPAAPPTRAAAPPLPPTRTRLSVVQLSVCRRSSRREHVLSSAVLFETEPASPWAAGAAALPRPAELLRDRPSAPYLYPSALFPYPSAYCQSPPSAPPPAVVVSPRSSPACPSHPDYSRSVPESSGSPGQARRRHRYVTRSDRNPLWVDIHSAVIAWLRTVKTSTGNPLRSVGCSIARLNGATIPSHPRKIEKPPNPSTPALHPLVGTIVVDERRTGRTDGDVHDSAEDDVVAGDRSDFNHPAVES